jgi:hypothetical protein
VVLKRLRKKAKKGQRGWPVGTVAFYGPDLARASKVAVGIVRGKGEHPCGASLRPGLTDDHDGTLTQTGAGKHAPGAR